MPRQVINITASPKKVKPKYDYYSYRKNVKLQEAFFARKLRKLDDKQRSSLNNIQVNPLLYHKIFGTVYFIFFLSRSTCNIITYKEVLYVKLSHQLYGLFVYYSFCSAGVICQ